MDNIYYSTHDTLTWVTGHNVKNSQQAYDWLVYNLGKYNTLLQGTHHDGSRIGFNPFVLSGKQRLTASWVRQFRTADPRARTSTVKLRRGKRVYEFITIVVPHTGCFTVCLVSNKPYKLAYVSFNALTELELDSEEYVDKYIADMRNAVSVDDALERMVEFVLL